MKIRSICAAAAGLALAPYGAAAYAEPAEEAPVEFRSVAPQTFTAEDLERYGLDTEAAARGAALQEQGYKIVALTPEEAEAYTAGNISQTEWILIGIGVLIILAVA
jgi:hypothetical protein